MKVNIYVIGFRDKAEWMQNSANRKNLHIASAGYAEVEEFNAEELWDLLNWSCWTDEKPKEVEHSPLTHCNSDIALNIDGTDVYHCALSFGWEEITANSLEEVLQFFKTSKHSFSFWPLYEGTNVII